MILQKLFNYRLSNSYVDGHNIECDYIVLISYLAVFIYELCSLNKNNDVLVKCRSNKTHSLCFVQCIWLIRQCLNISWILRIGEVFRILFTRTDCLSAFSGNNWDILSLYCNKYAYVFRKTYWYLARIWTGTPCLWVSRLPRLLHHYSS